MTDIFSYIGSGAILSLVGLMWKMTNGYVKRPECHQAQETIRQRIDDLKENICSKIDSINQRIDDLKEFIRNGR